MSLHTGELTPVVLDYLIDHGVREHPAQAALRADTAALPMAMMQISREQGAFMRMLVQLMGAKRCLEVGTFTGYSALAVALGLPEDGVLICCDVSEEWTSVGRPHWAAAGVADRIDLRLAPALETLDALLSDGQAGTFDFAFIDADKGNYLHYYERCLELLRPGGVVGVDNVLWSGSVADPSNTEASTQAIRALNTHVRDDPRVDISMLPVGDGLTLARKR